MSKILIFSSHFSKFLLLDYNLLNIVFKLYVHEVLTFQKLCYNEKEEVKPGGPPPPSLFLF